MNNNDKKELVQQRYSELALNSNSVIQQNFFGHFFLIFGHLQAKINENIFTAVERTNIS